MEVHHHPHVGKKSFKEYVFEGLMIFVAVSMGFIAENIREHIVESKHEVEYMKSLVNDLKLDTAYIYRSNKVKEDAIRTSKDLLKFFKENPTAKKIPVDLYYKMDTSNLLRIFISHTGTIDQLKNSGSLRLLKNHALVDSIESYYQQIKRIDNLNTLYINHQDYVNNLKHKMIVAKDIINDYDSIIYMKPFNTASNYFSISNEFLNEYINLLISIVRGSINAKFISESIMQKGVQLMHQINEEYHFEKE